MKMMMIISHNQKTYLK